jgi:hypothetical protein
MGVYWNKRSGILDMEKDSIKRIIVVTLSREDAVPERLFATRDHISRKLGDEYVVFVMAGIPGQNASFEMFTDEKIEPIELEALKLKLGIEE